jgi:Ca2+-transporting ATPase
VSHSSSPLDSQSIGASPHSLSAEAIGSALRVDLEHGLSQTEAASRLSQYGPNSLAAEEEPGLVRQLGRQLGSPLVIVLLVAALLSALVGDAKDAAVIMAVVVLNALIGVVQEARAGRALAALRAMSTPRARVSRGGSVESILASELVPGDLVELRAGDVVPADGRLLDDVLLQVDESALTGESLPVDKDPDSVLAEQTALADRVNMVYAGTAVSFGHARFLVTATGGRTELGGLASSVAAARPQPTPLERQVAWLGKVLAGLALAATLVVFLIGLGRGEPLDRMALVALSLAVAAVPEGLPAVVTIVLALGVQRMARRRAIVRRLASVEALGAATTICTDKTGTLTRGEMRVVDVLAGGRLIATERADGGTALQSAAELLLDPDLRLIAEAGLLANNAELEPRPIGDPTERALLYLADDLGLDRAALTARLPRLRELPFSSERRRMTTLHVDDGAYLAITKGAPDTVVPRCSRILMAGEECPFGDADRAQLEAELELLASDGLRLLALARRASTRSPLRRSWRDLARSSSAT